MLIDKPTNIYNINRNFDYATIKVMILKSFEKIVRKEFNRRLFLLSLQQHQQQQQQQGITDINQQRKLEIQDERKQEEEAITNYDAAAAANSLSTPILKLRLRNSSKYLNWRIAILKRDNFRCQICSASIKDNKTLRLEVHHAKTFNEIFKENNITNIKQALECKEIWNLDNGVCLCYRCHKDVEKLRTEVRNMFLLFNIYL